MWAQVLLALNAADAGEVTLAEYCDAPAPEVYAINGRHLPPMDLAPTWPPSVASLLDFTGTKSYLDSQVESYQHHEAPMPVALYVDARRPVGDVLPVLDLLLQNSPGNSLSLWVGGRSLRSSGIISPPDAAFGAEILAKYESLPPEQKTGYLYEASLGTSETKCPALEEAWMRISMTDPMERPATICDGVMEAAIRTCAQQQRVDKNQQVTVLWLFLSRQFPADHTGFELTLQTDAAKVEFDPATPWADAVAILQRRTGPVRLVSANSQ